MSNYFSVDGTCMQSEHENMKFVAVHPHPCNIGGLGTEFLPRVHIEDFEWDGGCLVVVV